MSILITGITGFAGRHLTRALGEAGATGIQGAMYPEEPGVDLPGVPLYLCDVRDRERVFEIVAEVRPDTVFHLAAQVVERRAYEDPKGTFETNVLGTMHLLEAVRTHCPEARVVVVGSSSQYGLVRPEELPIRETQPLRPVNPYGVSKAAQDLVAQQYALTYRLAVVRPITFNYTGPGQPPAAAVPAFAQQIAEIEAGRRPPVLQVGNLEAERDILDVRDVVRAYVLLAEKGTPGEAYNVCAGRAYRMQWILDTLLEMSPASIEVVQDPARMRPSDVPVQVGDASRLRQATGWQPQIGMEQTLADVLWFWRERAGQNEK